MHFGVVGINHKLADLRVRELLAKACQRRFSPGFTPLSEHTCVLLSTCNRTEIYFTSPCLVDTHGHILNTLREEVDEEFDQKLYSYFSQDCFSHLARVTAGLDSAILGETEIQGQVKTAYEAALKYLLLPRELHFLFQNALKIGKQVRTQLKMTRGMPDIEDAIWHIGRHFFGENSPRILFVGASAINFKILNFLKHKRYDCVSLCNRSRLHAPIEGIEMMPWGELNQWTEFDWIILGTKSPNHLLHRHEVEAIAKPKLIMDLSVPRNADPSLRTVSGITLMNIDQINRTLKIHKQKTDQILSDAEALIAGATVRHLEKLSHKMLVVSS